MAKYLNPKTGQYEEMRTAKRTGSQTLNPTTGTYEATPMANPWQNQFDSDLLNTVKTKYASQWGDKYYYDMSDPEDFYRMQTGTMPKYAETKYSSSAQDQWLKQNNLPPMKDFSDMYSEAYSDRAKALEKTYTEQKKTYDKNAAIIEKAFGGWNDYADGMTRLSEAVNSGGNLNDLLSSGEYDAVMPYYREKQKEEKEPTNTAEVVAKRARDAETEKQDAIYARAAEAAMNDQLPDQEFFETFDEETWNAWKVKKYGWDEETFAPVQTDRAAMNSDEKAVANRNIWQAIEALPEEEQELAKTEFMHSLQLEQEDDLNNKIRIARARAMSGDTDAGTELAELYNQKRRITDARLKNEEILNDKRNELQDAEYRKVDIAGIQQQYADLDEKIAEQKAISDQHRIGFTETGNVIYDAEGDAAQREIRKLEAEKAQLQTVENGAKALQTIDKYAAVKGNSTPDITVAKNIRESVLKSGAGINKGDRADTEIADLYTAIAAEKDPSIAGDRSLGKYNQITEAQQATLDYMSKEQKDAFIAIVNSGDMEAAREYYDALSTMGYREIMDAQTLEWERKAAMTPGLQTLKSSEFFTSQLPQAFEGAANLVTAMVNPDENPARMQYMAKQTRHSQVTRSYISDKIANSTYNVEKIMRLDAGKLYSFLYQNVTSMADNIARMPLAMVGGEALSLVPMAFGAASATMVESLQQGMSAPEAALYAIVAGAAEYVTEKVSLEGFLKRWENGYAINPLEILKEGGLQALAEGSEEVASSAINYLFDYAMRQDNRQLAVDARTLAAAVLAGEDVDISDRAKERILNARDPETAAYWHLLLTGLRYDFLGGALSGFVFGTTASTRATVKLGGFKEAAKYRQTMKAFDEFAKTVNLDGEAYSMMLENLSNVDMAPAAKKRIISVFDTMRTNLAEAYTNGSTTGVIATTDALIYSQDVVANLVDKLQNDLAKTAAKDRAATAEETKRSVARQERLQKYLVEVNSAQRMAQEAIASRDMNMIQQAQDRYRDALDEFKGKKTVADAEEQADLAKKEQRQQENAEQTEEDMINLAREVTGVANAVNAASEQAAAEQAEETAIAEEAVTEEVKSFQQENRQEILDALDNEAYKVVDNDAAFNSWASLSERFEAGEVFDPAWVNDLLGRYRNETGRNSGERENQGDGSRADQAVGYYQTVGRTKGGEVKAGIRKAGKRERADLKKASRKISAITGKQVTLVAEASQKINEDIKRRVEIFEQLTGQSVCIYKDLPGVTEGYNDHGMLYAKNREDGRSFMETLWHEYAEAIYNGDTVGVLDQMGVSQNLRDAYEKTYRKRLSAKYGPETAEKFSKERIVKEMFQDMAGIWGANINEEDADYTSLLCLFTNDGQRAALQNPEAYVDLLVEMADLYDGLTQFMSDLNTDLETYRLNPTGEGFSLIEAMMIIDEDEEQEQHRDAVQAIQDASGPVEKMFAKADEPVHGYQPGEVDPHPAQGGFALVSNLQALGADRIVSTREGKDVSFETEIGPRAKGKGNAVTKSRRTVTEIQSDPNGTIVAYRNGERMSDLTREDVAKSPVGALIREAFEAGYLGTGTDAEKEMNDQLDLFMTLGNMIINMGYGDSFVMAQQFIGSSLYTAMKTNSDKQYGTTHDFVSICTKTQAVVDEMSKAMVRKGAALTDDEIMYLYNRAFKANLPVSCPECYVFSRWIGIGSLLDNISRYQKRFYNMRGSELVKQYTAMSNEISDFMATHFEVEKDKLGNPVLDENGNPKLKNIGKGKAKGKMAEEFTKKRDSLLEEYETEQAQPIPDPKKLKQLKEAFEEYDAKFDMVKAFTWMEEVLYPDVDLNKLAGKTDEEIDRICEQKKNKRAFVPNEVLFDLNAGEDFSVNYPEAWGFRCTQGAGYGKAIAPYAESVVGEDIHVTSNNNAIKQKQGGTFVNQFATTDGNGELTTEAKKTLANARRKQLQQAWLGGQRWQSTSDARPENALDYLLSALQDQAMGAYGQSYTKVAEAVPMFATLGLDPNMSLMPMGNGLDANGNPKDTATGGMDPRKARALRDQYDEAGTITIGVNDEHIRKMFAQVWRDFIIPYHASGGKVALIAAMREMQDPGGSNTKAKSVDYTRTQSEKVLSDQCLEYYYDVVLGSGTTAVGYNVPANFAAYKASVKKARETRLAILTLNTKNNKSGKGKIHWELLDENSSEYNYVLRRLYDRRTSEQWRDMAPLATKTVEDQIYPNEYWDQDTTYETSGKNTRDYLYYCESLGMLHKFSGMVVDGHPITVNGKKYTSKLKTVGSVDAYGNKTNLTDLAYKLNPDGTKSDVIEDYFWKVLVDRRMYGRDGSYNDQRRIGLRGVTEQMVLHFAAVLDPNARQYRRADSLALAEQTAEEIVNGAATDTLKNIQQFGVGYLNRSQMKDRGTESVELRPGMSGTDLMDATLNGTSGFSFVGSDLSEKTDYGYHAGDLGKSESLGNQSGSRNTGHFGTGTYFFGSINEIQRGYNSRNGQKAPTETVDFSKYNLFRPKTESDGVALHDFLEGVDNLIFRERNLPKTKSEFDSIKDEMRNALDTEAYELTENGEFDFVDHFGKENFEDALALAVRAAGKDSVVDSVVGHSGLSENETKEAIDSGSLYDLLDDPKEVAEWVYDDLEWGRYDRKYEDWYSGLDKASQVLGVSEGELRMLTEEAMDSALEDYNTLVRTDLYKADSAATRLMKSLGYEGVDVRSFPGLDNSYYGSVIYDLKGKDLDRKNDIGTARFSLVTPEQDAEYMQLAKDPNKNESQLRDMVDKAATSAGYTIRAYHGSRNVFTKFSRDKLGESTGTQISRKWFFAADRETANSYYPLGVLERLGIKPSKHTVPGKLYDLYIKMENPLEIDAANYDYEAHREDASAFVDESNYAEANGHDGIIIRNVIDNNLNRDRASTDYLFKDPSQAKSADLVTYDDDGNIIPLSERFRTDRTGEDAWKNEDLRFSVVAPTGYTSDQRSRMLHYAKEYADEQVRGAVDRLEAETLGRQMGDTRKALAQQRDEYETIMAQTLGAQELAERTRANADSATIRRKEKMIERRNEKIDTLSQENLSLKIGREADESRINSLRERNAAQSRIIKEQRSTIDDMRAAQAEAIKNAKDKVKTAYERQELMKKVSKQCNELADWMVKPDPENYKSVPKVFYDTLGDALSNIDFRSEKRPQGNENSRSWADRCRQLQALADAAIEMKEGGDYDGIDLGIPAVVSESMKELAERFQARGVQFIQDMDNEELQDLSKDLAIIKHCVREANFAHTANRNATISERAERTFDEAQRLKPTLQPDDKWGSAITNLLDVEMRDAYSYARTLGAAAQEVVDDISKGFDVYYGRVKEASEYMQGQLLKATGLDAKTVNGWKEDAVELELESGEKVTLTTQQLMDLYLASHRAQSRMHLLNGGMQLTEAKGNKKFRNHDYRLTEGDLRNVAQKLTKQQKDFADGLQLFLAQTCSKWGNETTQKLWMIDAYGADPAYWPITSARNNIPSAGPEENRAFNAILHSSFTYLLNNRARNAIMIGNAMDTFNKHVAQMAAYNGLAIPIDDAMKWFNYKHRSVEMGEVVVDSNRTTKKAIERLMGKKGLSYFTQLMRDINGLSEGGTGTTIPNMLVSNMKRAAVAGKLRVVIQQPTAIIRAMALVNPKYFAKQNSGIADTIKEMQQRCPLAWWKANGNFDIGTGRSVGAIILGSDSNRALDKAVETAMKPAGLADDYGWAQIWNAIKNETAARHPDVQKGSARYWEIMNKRMHEVVDQTQVIDTMMHRSQIMRSQDSVVKQATSFMSEPIKTFNLMHNAIEDVRQGKQGAKLRLARTATFTFASIVLNSLVLGLHDALRDRDKDEPIGDLVMDSFTSNLISNSNPLNMIPYVSDVVSLWQGYSSERMDMSAVSDVMQTGKRLLNAIKNGGSSTYTTYGLLSSFGKAVGSLTGIPVTGLLSSTEALVNSVAPGALQQKKRSSKDQKRIDMVEQGVDRRDAYELMKEYPGNGKNIDKAAAILSFDRDGDGEPDLDTAQVDLIAEVLGLSYDPAEDGSLAAWAMADTEKKHSKGEITDDEYEDYSNIFTTYLSLY